MKKVNVAVLGATGLVGSTILKLLEERDFPLGDLHLFSSKRSAGQKINFKDKEYLVEELKEDSFNKRDIDLGLFAAGGAISQVYAPLAVEKGIVVIDNSSVFRMVEGVPLVVPEINPQDIQGERLIANPNCSTTQSVLPLKPLHDKYGVRRVVYSTYQAVSGSGLGGIQDLEEGKVEFYPHQIQGNALPHIDSFLETGYTKEEMKMVDETKKILKDENIGVTATAVRIPVVYGHSVSVNIELDKAFDLDQVKAELAAFPGIEVADDVENNVYPLALDVEGRDEVLVGRIRRDPSLENGLNLWVVADNIRKGAATNAVQIAELVAKNL